MWKSIVRPLGNVSPESDEILADTISIVFRTVVPASDSVQVNPLVDGFVSSAYTHEQVSSIGVVEVLTVLAGSRTNQAVGRGDERQLKTFLVPFSDFKKFPGVGVIEPEHGSLGVSPES